MSLPELPAVRGKLLRNEALAPYTWFRVGGPADALFIPADADDLADFLRALPRDVPVYPFGVGSNLVVRDGGMAGVVVRLAGRAFATTDTDGQRLTAGTGALDAMVARTAATAGIAGLEFFVGVPGTIGGALAMNAGCYGRETKDVLVSAEAITRAGERLTLTNGDFGFEYRRNNAPADLIFINATFEGARDDPAAIEIRMAEITARREATQPIREKTGGSTFANPDPPSTPNQRSSWKLIDEAGMRGHRRGGAQVSEKHCNFLINTGDATAADIEGLGEKVRAKVLATSGVDLHWEIKRIGRMLSGSAAP